MEHMEITYHWNRIDKDYVLIVKSHVESSWNKFEYFLTNEGQPIYIIMIKIVSMLSARWRLRVM